MDTNRLPLVVVFRKLWLVGGALLLAWTLVVFTAADAQAAPPMQTGFDCSSVTEIPTAECPAVDIPIVITTTLDSRHVTLTDARINYWPLPTLLSPFGIVEIKATLRNITYCPIWDIVVHRVRGLNGNLLLKADVPTLLQQRESHRVSFVIGLWQLLPFPLDVSFVGSLVVCETPGPELMAGEDTPLPLEVTVEALEAGRQEGRFYLERVYLPAVSH